MWLCRRLSLDVDPSVDLSIPLNPAVRDRSPQARWISLILQTPIQQIKGNGEGEEKAAAERSG
jgi:hypothetical protein